jgi:hypothetical protein
MLYNHTIPPDGGGDTMFASTYAAYEALSDKIKAFLSGSPPPTTAPGCLGWARPSPRTR